jgi:acetylornithine deacetylase/succinyl-diaminopimelate desuccinylase-like protein
MTTTDRILAAIDPAEVIQIARDLVAIPSITHEEGDGMVRFYTDWFADLNIPVRLFPVDEHRAHFFADFPSPDGSTRLLFNGHQDTKPVAGMTVPPFGEVRDGRLYGRGSCDMKGAIAAVLCAMKALVRAGVHPPAGMTFYSDIEEEYGGPDGYPRIVEEGLTSGYSGVVCCEPTEMRVCIGNKGGVVTAFEVRGHAAHSSTPYSGRNAIHDMVRFISAYLDLPYLAESDPVFGLPTVNFEMIDGGQSESTLPDRCVACLDTRIIPSSQPQVVVAQYETLMAHLRAETGMDIRETDPPAHWRPRRGQLDAMGIDPAHPLAVAACDAISTALGREPTISALEGATFGGYMIARGLPSIILGPGSIRQAHTEDEWVELAEVVGACRVYGTLIGSAAG